MSETRETREGCPYGSHRVIEPRGVLPQPALRIDNTMERIWPNEILVDVETLNIDSASFTQMEEACHGDAKGIADLILATVAERGKMHNKVTGSGGMFIGTVEKVGSALAGAGAAGGQQGADGGRPPLKPGTRIASLVSLSLTPLRIDRILEVKTATDQVTVQGKAILFESGIYAVLPDDMPAAVALAVLDVAGAPAQTRRLARKGNTVTIEGASGKSGILCCFEAKRKGARVIGLAHSEKGRKRLLELGLCDEIAVADAKDALGCYRTVRDLTGGALSDLVINCTNVPDTEMGSILCCKERGLVYFFGMATSFTKAALGAEGVGKDIDMMIGNGYAAGHADVALDILRDSPEISALYRRLYT